MQTEDFEEELGRLTMNIRKKEERSSVLMWLKKILHIPHLLQCKVTVKPAVLCGWWKVMLQGLMGDNRTPLADTVLSLASWEGAV
jgi:hypothetical protein